jgi:hypothetical protein
MVILLFRRCNWNNAVTTYNTQRGSPIAEERHGYLELLNTSINTGRLWFPTSISLKWTAEVQAPMGGALYEKLRNLKQQT